MVWFQDESPYIDDSPGAGPGAVHAGWLEQGHRFSRGPIDRDVLDRLAAICIGWNETESQRRERARLWHRGTHDCSLCWTGRRWTRWQLVVDEGEIGASQDRRKRETLGSQIIAIEAAVQASGERADRICLWQACRRRASRGMFVCARHA